MIDRTQIVFEMRRCLTFCGYAWCGCVLSRTWTGDFRITGQIAFRGPALRIARSFILLGEQLMRVIVILAKGAGRVGGMRLFRGSRFVFRYPRSIVQVRAADT